MTSNFSFSHSFFYLYEELYAFVIKAKIDVCKLFQFGRVQNLLLGKGSGTFISYYSVITGWFITKWQILNKAELKPSTGDKLKTTDCISVLGNKILDLYLWMKAF